MNRTTRLPWIKLYVTDLQGETAHLSNADLGAYLRLMLTYWSKGLPSDAAKLRKLAHIHTTDDGDLETILMDLFLVDESGIHHPGLDALMDKAIGEDEANKRRTANATAKRAANRLAGQSGLPERNDARNVERDDNVTTPPTLHRCIDVVDAQIPDAQIPDAHMADATDVPEPMATGLPSSSSLEAEMEAIARNVGCSLEKLQNSKPDQLSPIQKTAKMRLVRLLDERGLLARNAA